METKEKTTDVVESQVTLNTAQLDTEVTSKLQKLNTDINSLFTALGQSYIRKRELINETERVSKSISDSEESYESLNKEFSNILADLDKKYPNGQINLAQGTVTYQPLPEETTK
jgi:seryl-tRNA synthetase